MELITDLPLDRLEVVVDGVDRLGGDDALTYGCPRHLSGLISVGDVVWVPLRRRIALGVVIGVGAGLAPGVSEVRPIFGWVEPRLTIDRSRLAVAKWLARGTASSRFAVMNLFLPPGIRKSMREHFRLVRADDGSLTAAQREVVAALEARGDLSLEQLRAATGRKLTAVVGRLVRDGVIERVPRSASVAEPRRDRYVRLRPAALSHPESRPGDRAPRQQAVLDYLARRARLVPVGEDGYIPAREVIRRTSSDYAVIGALAQKGLIESIERPLHLVRSTDDASTDPAPALTTAQAEAWRAIECSLSARDPKPHLLLGVTGSGKTEVYLRAIAWCLRHGRGALLLVPEIGLATQVVHRVRARFPGQVAVFHSALSERERESIWRQIAAGELRVVVGPRSALFTPVNDPGLIILDEEHESAYKQDADPRYHARACAEALARQLGASVILGSATPSVETSYRAKEERITRLVLPYRVGRAGGRGGRDTTAEPLELPPVEIVDLRLELHRGNTSLLSDRLRAVLTSTLAAGEQAIVLLNRRGMATIVLCRSCGGRLICPQCDVPLVFHQDRGRLLCHRCGYRESPPSACGECGGILTYFGAGTQRVETEVAREYPSARVLRWDQDTTRRRGSTERMLASIERREVDIIVGTQMIAKGLDLPLVTAVGVINADAMLHLPDFRSAERTFQLLTQVAGRAGRRAAGATVVIQSYTPRHYAIQAASRHDYDGFLDEEITFREQHRYPPFTRLIRLVFRHADEAVCMAEADLQARLLSRHIRECGQLGIADILGPTPAFVSKVRGEYQWQIVVRSDDLDPLLDGLPRRAGWVVDVDPQSML